VILAALATAFSAMPELQPCSVERHLGYCLAIADEALADGFDTPVWTLRRELTWGMTRAEVSDGERGAAPLERACVGALPSALACLARHALLAEEDPSVGIDSEWSRRACALGDRGSCLSEALADPAQLADHCEHGAANACAWHAEKARLGEANDVARAAGWAQRACMELHEPVACAAAGKLLHDRGSTASAALAHERACTLGYAPSCDPDPERALADEAPPRILGPSFLVPGTLKPLPGRPALPE
jgi:hypothetical protein